MSGTQSQCVDSSVFENDNWDKLHCPSVFYLYVNDNNGQVEYNQNQMLSAQNSIVTLFNNYLASYQFTDTVTSSVYNPFQNKIVEFCSNQSIPGICDQALIRYCSSYTRDQVDKSPILIDLCGCYVTPDPTYLTYTNKPACDPLCRRRQTAQRITLSTGIPVSCLESVCVIDDVLINTINSTIAGGINFNSVCSGCGDDCLCIISGYNLTNTLATIGITDTTINQFCSTTSTCIVRDTDGTVKNQGPCKGSISPANFEIPNFKTSPNIWFVIILIIIAIIIIISLLATRYAQYHSYTVQDNEIDKKTKSTIFLR